MWAYRQTNRQLTSRLQRPNPFRLSVSLSYHLELSLSMLKRVCPLPSTATAGGCIYPCLRHSKAVRCSLCILGRTAVSVVQGEGVGKPRNHAKYELDAIAQTKKLFRPQSGPPIVPPSCRQTSFIRLFRFVWSPPWRYKAERLHAPIQLQPSLFSCNRRGYTAPIVYHLG